MTQQTNTVTRTATTWIRNAKWRLTADHERAEELPPGERRDTSLWLSNYHVTEFVQATLAEVEELLPIIDRDDENADDIDEVEQDLVRMARLLKARRLAAKLANVEGRTPAEVALFEAKARELGGTA